MKVRVVDLNDSSAPQAVTESLIESGFAVVENHPVPINELHELYSRWDAFFLSDEPSRFTTDANSQSGYFSSDQAETAKGLEAQIGRASCRESV